MNKILCIFSMVVSAIIGLVFLTDLLIAMPFARASLLLDLGFLLGAGVIGAFSFLTFRELR